MNHPRRISGILIGCLAAATLFGTARAQDQAALYPAPGPDAARLREIEAELRDEGRARILGDFFDMEVSAPRAQSEGIRYDTILPVRGGGRTAPDTVSWSEIWKIQVRRSSALKGATTGALVTGGIGLIAGLSSMRECEGWLDFGCGLDAGDVAVLTATSAAVGVVVGALIGAPFHHWKTVYGGGS